MIKNLWHDSSQRRRDLPEKREESEAARIGRETHFGRPKTSCQRGSSQDLRNGRTTNKQVRLRVRREEGKRRLIWRRDQIFEDSDGGRASPRERVRPLAIWGGGGSGLYALSMKLAPQEFRTYLLTAVTAQRRRLFQVTATAELLISTVEDYRAKGRFALHAFVVMPDHVHLLLTPAPDVSLEKVAQLIKGGFSFRLKSARDVWERGYDNRRITDGEHFETCRRYIEDNPVRARMVESAEAYAYSSCGRDEMLDPKPQWFGQG
jgi:putative transposase